MQARRPLEQARLQHVEVPRRVRIGSSGVPNENGPGREPPGLLAELVDRVASGGGSTMTTSTDTPSTLNRL
ncbi:hypothetical protein Psuf_061500 [Phytohabitans suffuscus]|uniref:Uncharacterized protein n=1 Tax=Phytohabitans suffuscus TaxID=624315 RepID=A0A6F8YRR1_9ACTN|nr:hypothetical protein Psuf_061500 [Phytohabitans suffuscus]